MQFRHELVIPSESYDFRLFSFEGKDGNYCVSKHWHNSVEIFLVMEGTMSFYINNERHVIDSGDFIIVNSNEIHSIDCPNPNQTVVLQIPLQAFDGYMDERHLFYFIRQDKIVNGQLVNLIYQMYLLNEEKNYGYRLKVKSLFLDVLYLLLTQFKSQMDEESILQKKHLYRLSGVIAYMKEHYNEEITLDQVAIECGFTATYLSRIFKKYADINYLTYLQNLRLEFAVKELLNTDNSIGSIAIHHGFSDSRAFTKAFKKRYQCLPSEYRKVQKNVSKEIRKRN